MFAAFPTSREALLARQDLWSHGFGGDAAVVAREARLTTADLESTDDGHGYEKVTIGATTIEGVVVIIAAFAAASSSLEADFHDHDGGVAGAIAGAIVLEGERLTRMLTSGRAVLVLRPSSTDPPHAIRQRLGRLGGELPSRHGRAWRP